MPIMMLIVEILLIIMGIRWKTWKQTENCREKQKIPAANGKLAAGKLKTFWKQQDLFCFFSKKLPPPLPNSRNRQKSGNQGGQTAPKWLDNTVKPCPKIGWRNRHFSTIQQRNKPVTSFLSQAYGGDDQIWTGEWRFCRPLPYHNDRRISVIFRTFARFSYVLITFNIYTITNWYLSTTWWHYYSTYPFILATLSYTRQSFISGM